MRLTALSHLPGLALTAAIAIGISAMTAGMLRLPMTAVLLSTLLLGSGGFAATPLSIVAAAVAYLTVNVLADRLPAHEAATAASPTLASAAVDGAPAT